MDAHNTTGVVPRQRGYTSVVVTKDRRVSWGMSFGERLLEARKARDLNQLELGRRIADYLGRRKPVKQQTISALERRRSSRTEFFHAIVAVLKVNPDWLQTGRGDSGLSSKAWKIGEQTHQIPVSNDNVLTSIIAKWPNLSPQARARIENFVTFEHNTAKADTGREGPSAGLSPAATSGSRPSSKVGVPSRKNRRPAR